MAVVVAAARDEAEPAGLLEAAQRACGAEEHAGARCLGLALMLAAILEPSGVPMAAKIGAKPLLGAC